MKALIILLLLLTAGPVIAEKGIVMNASDFVQYKYDTPTKPALEPGQYIVLTDDINAVLKDASYDKIAKTFKNPDPVIIVPEEEIKLVVTPDPLDPTQVIISGLSGAGAAYLVVRRKKV